jgi:hypothetical protein
MVAAIREDRTPNLLLMRYALATWEVRDLLLIPSFMFSESAVIKRPRLAETCGEGGSHSHPRPAGQGGWAATSH